MKRPARMSPPMTRITPAIIVASSNTVEAVLRDDSVNDDDEGPGRTADLNPAADLAVKSESAADCRH